MKPWNLKQVEPELNEAMAMCNSKFERDMAAIYIVKDIERMLSGRKATPGEVAIAAKYGINIGYLGQ